MSPALLEYLYNAMVSSEIKALQTSPPTVASDKGACAVTMCRTSRSPCISCTRTRSHDDRWSTACIRALPRPLPTCSHVHV